MTSPIFSRRAAANWVTIFRIVAVAFPCWLILRQPSPTLTGPPVDPLPFWLALGMFIIIGVTDYIDGMLARRYGSTDFGSFLDPLSDKIFTTLTFLTNVQFGLVPFWPVPLVLLRETGITELRSLASVARADFKTSAMGKYKTNVQGWGSGGILLNYILWDNLYLFEAIVGTAGVALTVLGIRSWIRSGKLSWAWIIGAGSVYFHFFGRLVLPTSDVILYYWIFMMLITVYSGLEYVVVGYRPTMAGLRSAGQLRLLALALINAVVCVVVPLTPAMLGYMPYIWSGVAISFEVAILGIENHLTMTGARLPVPLKSIKLGLQICALAVFSWAGLSGLEPAATWMVWGCLIPSVLFGAVYMIHFAPRISFTGVSQP